MTASAAILTRSWPVGPRICTLSVPPIGAGTPLSICVEWEPTPPKNLTRQEWRQYREGRQAVMDELGQLLGVKVAVLEL